MGNPHLPDAPVGLAPLLFLADWERVRHRWLVHRLSVGTALLSIAFHFVGAMGDSD
jgi:hypothetical protein